MNTKAATKMENQMGRALTGGGMAISMKASGTKDLDRGGASGLTTQVRFTRENGTRARHQDME